MYSVYIVRCSDDTLYTGITLDVTKRIIEHNTKNTGATYTRSRRPVTLVYTEHGYTKSDALKREHALKKMSRKEKLSLVENYK